MNRTYLVVAVKLVVGVICIVILFVPFDHAKVAVNVPALALTASASIVTLEVYDPALFTHDHEAVPLRT